MERPLTIFDFKHAGGTLIDGFKIVLYGDDGRSVFMVEMREKVIDFVSACAVEPRRRLVEHDEIIVAEQRPCNENALPLTAGKIAEKRMSGGAHADGGKCMLNRVFAADAAHAPPAVEHFFGCDRKGRCRRRTHLRHVSDTLG